MKSLMLVLMLIASSVAMAQEDLEYKMEIGGGVGLVSYQGDFNGSLTKGMQPVGMLTARLKPNPRMAWALNIGLGNIKGEYKNTGTYYPDLADNHFSFSNMLVDGGVRFEYNFWPYGTGNDYRGAKRLTPFITVGMGMSFADTEGGSVVGVNFPVGAGIKYKLTKRLNLTAEWTEPFSTTDKLDGVADPYGIKSSGMFKNKDCYGMLLVGLTYDIWAKCRTCHNEDY